MATPRENEQFIIRRTQRRDIPVVTEMVRSERREAEALAPLSNRELEGWVDQGRSIVAQDRKGRIVGHQAATQYPDSGWVELRSAVVHPSVRGQGLNTRMKEEIIEKIREHNPEATIAGVTAEESKSKGILQKLGFEEHPTEEAPQEIFNNCPAKCVRKTGEDCGCTVFVKKPNTSSK